MTVQALLSAIRTVQEQIVTIRRQSRPIRPTRRLRARRLNRSHIPIFGLSRTQLSSTSRNLANVAFPCRPIKRPEPDSDSSSSSSGYSVASGSSVQLVKNEKHHKKKKKTADFKAQPKRNRSLSPIEAIDSYVIQHALQDLRRKNNPAQAQSASGQNPQTNGTPIDIDSDDAAPINQADETARRSTSAGTHLRSPSAGPSGHIDPFHRAASFSLTPMPEVKPPTEEEQEARFGTAVTIRVEMVFDPRVPVTDLNRQQIKQYEAPVIVKTRQVTLGYSRKRQTID